MRFPTIIIATILFSLVRGLDLPVYSKCNPIIADVTAARGHITSPNYPSRYTKNLDCKWNIRSPRGVGIRMTIEHLDNKEIYETGTGKCFDKLRIASLDSRGSPKYLHNEDELCAKSINELTRKVFEIPNNSDGTVIAQISFNSDYEDHGTGFSIYFEALCNKTEVGESGVITSPNYPNKYPAYSDCFTEIQAPFGSVIEIEFTNFQVEPQTDCLTDYVVVIEGPPGLYGTTRNKYCTADIGTLTIKTYVATVEFVSNGDLADSGFRANWKAVFPTTTKRTTTTTTTTTTTASTTTSTTLETTTIEMKNCSYTNQSLLCQRWDVLTPHEPKYTPNETGHNYCRNPDGDGKGPWCYTTDPDVRWQYCDVDNCIGPDVTTNVFTSTESTSVETSTPAETASSYLFSTVVPIFPADPSVSKQTHDETKAAASLPWYAYLVIAAALVVFVVVVLIFVLRRRRRKAAMTVTSGNIGDAVAFTQYERDQYGERPRENTYVEIPFLGEVHERNAPRPTQEVRNDTCGKGSFVRLPNCQSKNSSVSSLDSIQDAKETAQRNFQAINRGASTSDANPYSVAEEVTNVNQAPPLPEDRANRSMRVTVEQALMDEANVYHSIEVSQPVRQGNSFAGTPLPPPPVKSERNLPKANSQKQNSKEKKFTKKASKPEINPSSGFENPSYTERENRRNSLEDEKNPFDTDDEGASTYNVPATLPQRSESTDTAEGSSLYNVPSMIPKIPETENVHLKTEDKKPTKADSPYMMPKISMPNKLPNSNNKLPMVPISPDLIDADKKEEATLYSSPNPTSPIFEMKEEFTYDSPRDGRSAASSFSSRTESEGGRTESSRSARDSGNASLSALELVADDRNEEYCIMSSVSRPTLRKQQTTGSEGANENRLSQLYLSMKGLQNDRRVSESTWQSTKKQSSNPRKSV